MAKGLIPLMLSSPDSTSTLGSWASGTLRSPSRASCSPPSSPVHKRHQSDGTPIIKLSRPPVRANMRRQSQQVPASLPHIPYTSAEWKKAISEIKRYHVTRRYRACSARCNEILTNVRTISAVEPAYLIYLNFYAATSLEMCARPLASASTYRLSLLHQARAHYDRAAALIRAAEDSATLRTRSFSVASSLPSLHSPEGSISSRGWTPESGYETPTTCAHSRKSSLTASSSSTCTPRSTKKKVSFELPRDKSQWSFAFVEPVIRPDSPTLGFDDEYFLAGAMRQELPELPTLAGIDTRRFSGEELDAYNVFAQQQHSPSMPSISERDELLVFASVDSPTTTGRDSPSTDSVAGCDEFPFFRFPQLNDDNNSCSSSNNHQQAETTRAMGRYCETLVALKVQVASHMAALDEVLARDLQLSSEAVTPASPVGHDAGSLVAGGVQRSQQSSGGAGRHSWRASGGAGGHGPRSSGSAPTSSLTREGEENEQKARERKARIARIDRLKMGGWRRERFNPARYEDLCDVVLAELNHA